MAVDPFVNAIKAALSTPLDGSLPRRPRGSRGPASRLVKFIRVGIDAEDDLKYLGRWARACAVSVSTLTETCDLAGITRAHDVRDLMRILRARIKSLQTGDPLEAFLDLADRRTLAALVERGGIADGSATATVAGILDRQKFLPAEHLVIRLLRDALEESALL